MNEKWIVATAALLGLAACSSTGSIQAKNSDDMISGKVTRNLIEPHAVEVTLDGKTYSGEWRTGAPTAEQKATTTYPHKHHVGQVNSVLISGDGSKLDCQWQTHSQAGEGTCKVGNREVALILK